MTLRYRPVSGGISNTNWRIGVDGDTLAGNSMIDDDDRVLLVDFEYASNKERAYEIALWFDEMAFPEAIERELIELYFGALSPALDARVNVMKALGDLKWSSWAIIQEAVSTLDFEYYKCGSWKYMHAARCSIIWTSTRGWGVFERMRRILSAPRSIRAVPPNPDCPRRAIG